MSKKLEKRLEIMLDEKLKLSLTDEAKQHNITVGELCRRKLIMDFPDPRAKEATNNDLMKRIIEIEQNVYMCYRLLVSMMLINHGRDASIRNVCDLNEEEVTTLASNFDITVSEILPDFSAKEG